MHLLNCEVHCTLTAGMNQVIDRLGFCEVDATVQKSAPGEFPGFSHAGSHPHRESADMPHQVGTSVTLQFCNVFSGEAVGLAKDYCHRAIDADVRLGVEDITKLESPRFLIIANRSPHGPEYL